MIARPWRRAVIELGLKYGQTPRQFLQGHTSADIAELVAYFNLQAEQADRRKVDEQLHKAFGKPKHGT